MNFDSMIYFACWGIRLKVFAEEVGNSSLYIEPQLFFNMNQII